MLSLRNQIVTDVSRIINHSLKGVETGKNLGERWVIFLLTQCVKDAFLFPQRNRLLYLKVTTLYLNSYRYKQVLCE